MRRPPFTPRKVPVLISIRGWVDPRAIVQMEELGQMKSPMTSSVFEPTSFRFVPLCLNQLRYVKYAYECINYYYIDLIIINVNVILNNRKNIL
jgi:hypothetical protein